MRRSRRFFSLMLNSLPFLEALGILTLGRCNDPPADFRAERAMASRRVLSTGVRFSEPTNWLISTRSLAILYLSFRAPGFDFGMRCSWPAFFTARVYRRSMRAMIF